MGTPEIIDERKSGKDYVRASSVFKDVVWIYDINDPRVLEVIRTSVRKWVDGVENFAQYIVRRLQYSGVLVELDSNLYPVHDGYTLTLTFKVRGIRGDALKPVLKTLSRHARGDSEADRKLRRIAEMIMRMGFDVSDLGIGDTRTDNEEVAGEGEEAEHEG